MAPIVAPIVAPIAAPLATQPAGAPAVRAPNPVASQMREQRAEQQALVTNARAPHDRAAVRATAAEIVELLWFDKQSVDRIRETLDWLDRYLGPVSLSTN